MNKRKKEIIDITMKLIKDNGYDKVSIIDICREIGIAKSTFYYYFNSKEEVFKDFYSIEEESFFKNINILLMEPNPVKQIKYLCHHHTKRTEDAGVEIIKMVIKSNLDFNYESITQYHHSPTRDIMTTLIRNGQEKNVLKNKANPEFLSDCFYYIVIGVTEDWCINNASFDQNERIWEMTKALLGID